MSASLLASKFYFPPARTNLIPRPHLIERLMDGLRGALTLISAPARYGKPTLLSEWHIRAGVHFPCTWLSLYRGDAELFRFWEYAIASKELEALN